MQELEDLKTSVATAIQDVADENAELADIVTKLKAAVGQPTLDKAAIVDLTTRLGAQHTVVQAAIQAAKDATAPT